jgi:hypothetical protein
MTDRAISAVVLAVKKMMLFVPFALMAACGGLTGPTGLFGHAGTYSGPMTYADDHSTTNAQTTVSQIGSGLELTSLRVASTNYPLGSATLTGDAFSGTSSYDSLKCGKASSAYQGRFSGNQMHLKVSILLLSPPPGAACSGGGV